jgi:hypothetical protein
MKTAKKTDEKADEKTRDDFAKCVRKLRRGRPLKKRKTLPLFEEMVASLSIVGKSLAGSSTKEQTIEKTKQDVGDTLSGAVTHLRLLSVALGPDFREIVEKHMGDFDEKEILEGYDCN